MYPIPPNEHNIYTIFTVPSLMLQSLQPSVGCGSLRGCTQFYRERRLALERQRRQLFPISSNWLPDLETHMATACWSTYRQTSKHTQGKKNSGKDGVQHFIDLLITIQSSTHSSEKHQGQVRFEWGSAPLFALPTRY